VAALIAQKFGVRLGVTAVGRLLAELDITPQKPLRRAYERDPAAIKQTPSKGTRKIRAILGENRSRSSSISRLAFAKRWSRSLAR